MNIVELQIQFQQKIQDINPIFGNEDRPSSFSIVNYLNKAIHFYIKEKYLSLPTFEQRLAMIDENYDEIKQLIVSDHLLGNSATHTKQNTNLNWGTRSRQYRLPDDCLMPISLSVNVWRNEVVPMTSGIQFAKFVNRRQAERLISDNSDKTIHIRPLAFLENDYFLNIVGDAYVTDLEASELTYLRKPFDLSFEYTEYTSLTSSINVTSPPVGTYFRPLCDIVYDSVSYIAGSKVVKLAGVNTATVDPIDNTSLKIGYPYGLTDVPEIDNMSHMKIVDLAVSLFIDEAKLKLVPRQAAK